MGRSHWNGLGAGHLCFEATGAVKNLCDMLSGGGGANTLRQAGGNVEGILLRVNAWDITMENTEILYGG